VARSRAKRVRITPYELDALSLGLYAAERLAAHFPLAFAAHVTSQRTSLQALLSCAEALLYWAHAELIQLDSGDEVVSIGETHPGALCAPRLMSRPAAVDRLVDDLGPSLRYPMPLYWGLDRDALVDGNPTDDVLAKAVLAVMHPTSWHLDLPDAWWRTVLMVPWADIIASVRPMAPQTDVPALLSTLDSLVVWDTPDLAMIVRYIHSMTDNPYADYAYSEVVEMGSSVSWDWSTDELRAEGVAQRQALAIADHYVALERRIHADPALLGQLLTTLVALSDMETVRAQVARGEPHLLPLFPEAINDPTTIAGVAPRHTQTMAASHPASVPAGCSAPG